MAFARNILDEISVAKPCDARWDDMKGDERVRFCGLCRLNVYNLSGMRRAEAEALVRAKEGNLCVRLYQRQDGTLLTEDCPVGLRALKRRLALVATGLAASLAFVFGCLSSWKETASDGTPAAVTPRPGTVRLMGKMCVAPRQRVTMGEMAARPSPPEVATDTSDSVVSTPDSASPYPGER